MLYIYYDLCHAITFKNKYEQCHLSSQCLCFSLTVINIVVLLNKMAAYVLPLICLFFTIQSSVFCVNFTVINSNGEQSYNSGEKVVVKEEAEQVLIENENLPILNESFVEINNTLTKIVIRDCGVKDIVAGAFIFSTSVIDEIIVTKNEIHTIREGVFNEAKVRILNLTDNKIVTVESGALNNNSYLEIIDLSVNDITFLDPLWFSGSNNLWQFSIERNKIEDINEAAFQTFAWNKSVVIKLATNVIKKFDPILLKNFEHIDVLDLSNNYLEEIDDELFINRTFNYLNLENNKLTCLPDSAFRANVTTVNLMRNMSFRCECLEKLKELVESRRIIIFYPSIICEYKEKLIMIVYNKNTTSILPIPKPADYIIPNGILTKK